MWLFLIFVAVPIIEIALFIQVGGVLGLFQTLAIVVLTAVAGTFLVRQQGFSTLARLQSAMDEGGNPVNPLLHGILILAAGLLLLTPGFFTDAVGLSLMIPAVRDAAIRWGAGRIRVQGVVLTPDGPNPAHDQPGPDAPIDADFEMVEPDDDGPRGSSGWTKGPDT